MMAPGVFTPKTSFHITPEQFESAAISPVILDLCLRKTQNGSRPNVSFLNCFSSTLKCKAGVFKFLWFEEHFQKKLHFRRDGLVWTVALTVEI